MQDQFATQSESTGPQATAPAPAIRQEASVPMVDGQFKPGSLDALWRLANIIAKSGLCPKSFDDSPAKVFVAMSYGLEVGLSPMSSVSSIYVVDDRPCLFGDAPLAIAMEKNAFDTIQETFEGVFDRDLDKTSDDFKAVCVIKPAGKNYTVTREFSVGDAKLAGLWMKKTKHGNTTPWLTHPKRMLQFKARTFCIRDACPSALRGIAVYDDIIESVSELPAPAPHVAITVPPPLPALTGSSTTTGSGPALEPTVLSDEDHGPLVSGAKTPLAVIDSPPTPESMFRAIIKEQGWSPESAEGLVLTLMGNQGVSREEVLGTIFDDPGRFISYAKPLLTGSGAPPPDGPASPDKPKTRKTRSDKGVKKGMAEPPPAEAPAAPPATDPEVVAPTTDEAPGQAPAEEKPNGQPIALDAATAPIANAEPEPSEDQEPLSDEAIIRDAISKCHKSDRDLQKYSVEDLLKKYFMWVDRNARVTKMTREQVLADFSKRVLVTVMYFKKFLNNLAVEEARQIFSEPAKPPEESPPGNNLTLEGGTPTFKERLQLMKTRYPEEFEQVRAENGFGNTPATEEGAQKFVMLIHERLNNPKSKKRK